MLWSEEVLWSEEEPVVEPVEATELLWPVVSALLAVELLGEDEVLLELGGVELWSA